jgi:hypothetical protein
VTDASRDPGGWTSDWAPDLDGPERDEVDDWSALSAAERAEIERLNFEIGGLLPLALDPVEPSPAVAREISRQVAEVQSPATGSSAGGPPVASFPARPAMPSWLLPLAAVLTLLAIGLAASLFGIVRDQRLELAALEAQVEELTRDSAELAVLEEGLAHARQNLQLVSSEGVEICPLRPIEGAAPEGPYGLLFIAADHQHWYVRVTGLKTDPERYYRLWFEAADGSLVPAGNLLGQELELSSPTMPEGTRAVHVSVETQPEPPAPSGEFVLFGNDMIRVL